MNARVLGLLAPLVFAAAGAHAQNGYPEWNGRSVQDNAGVLSQKMEDSVRALLAPARNQGYDVRVVTVGRMSRYVGGEPTIETFAQGLFNAWRVGDRPENDGVLLVVATQDRKVRIQLGDGALKYQGAAQQVVSDSLVRWFREDKMVRGILRGTAGIAQWFTPQGQAAFAPPPPPPAAAPQPAYSTQPASGDGGHLPAIAITLTAMLFGGLGLSSYLRNRPRNCPQCKAPMARLDETADDIYLESGQKCEEYLGSVDYDVWKCGACGTHTLSRHGSWLSSKSRCPSCSYVTLDTTKRVLQYATYDYGGEEEVIRDCRHCNYHDRDIVYLPRKTRPSPSSHSSSSGSSSYSSSSSSSGGGGGGGGGYSSGGGASGSW